MQYPNLPPKVIKKYQEELIDLYKRCIKTYLVSKGLNYKSRKKFEKLFDRYISYRNIKIHFNIPINLFVQALVKDELNSFFKFQVNKHVHKHSKKSIHRKK